MIDPVAPFRRRCGALLGSVAAAVVLATMLTGPSAAAHGGETSVEVVSRTPGGDRSVTYEIRLEFEDGHAVEDATVTAVAEAADGASVGPVEMAPGAEPGRYTATLQFPAAGAWTVRFSSADPEVTSSLEETVEEAVPSSVGSEVTTTVAPTTIAVAPSTTASPAADATEPAATDDISSTSTGLWVALGVVAVVVLVGTFVITRRGKRDEP